MREVIGIGLALVVGCGDVSAVARDTDTDTDGSGSTTTTTTTTSTSTSTTTTTTTTTFTSTSTSTSTSLDSDSGSSAGSELGPAPIVLAHGFFGFDDLADLNFANYFYGIVDTLEDAGEPLVFTPEVDPFNDSTVRGLQLLDHVESIVEQTGHEHVVLIGHSQGGLDARVVANLRPDLVAAVVTIATPHHGTPVSDAVLGLVSDPAAQALVDALVNLVGAGIWDEIDGDTSLSLSLAQFSTPGIEAFNATYPDAPGVRYVSLTGRSLLSLGGDACAADDPPEFVSQWSDERDPIDPLFATTGAYIRGNPLDPTPNDGLVPAESARWGEFLGCIPADHADQIGQVLGDAPGLLNAWDHHDFWVALVEWIRDEGL